MERLQFFLRTELGIEGAVTDEAVFENVIRTNLTAAFVTVNSAAPLLNDNGSSIFTASVHNYLGQAGVAAYAVWFTK